MTGREEASREPCPACGDRPLGFGCPEPRVHLWPERYREVREARAAGRQTTPRCAHCRQEKAECQAAVAARDSHAHSFSPTAKGNWFDCPLCPSPPARETST